MNELKLLKEPIFWLIAGLILIGLAIVQIPDHHLHLVCCDVGQGDAALISRGKTQILVDGGPDNRVLSCLADHLPFWDRRIEMVIASHPDADHIAGLIDVLKRYQVKTLIINSFGKETALFDQFKQSVEAEGALVYFPKKGDRFRAGGLEMTVLWPESQDRVLGATTLEKGANEVSIVFQLSYGRFDALFPGDISTKIEDQLELEDIEVLKVPHHGSKFSTGQEFLAEIKPELAVISVGRNRFGHPTEEVIERLEQESIKLLRTDQESKIEVVTDGKSWEIIK